MTLSIRKAASLTVKRMIYLELYLRITNHSVCSVLIVPRDFNPLHGLILLPVMAASHINVMDFDVSRVQEAIFQTRISLQNADEEMCSRSSEISTKFHRKRKLLVSIRTRSFIFFFRLNTLFHHYILEVGNGYCSSYDAVYHNPKRFTCGCKIQRF